MSPGVSQSVDFAFWEGLGFFSHNLAEAKALRRGLKLLMERKVWRVKVLGDSQLIIKLVLNRWQCNNSRLEYIVKEIKYVLSYFEEWESVYLRRNLNVWADELAKKGSMKKKGMAGWQVLSCPIRYQSLRMCLPKSNFGEHRDQAQVEILINWVLR
eukprot:Gb_23627 [translate_table: standard]